MGLTDAIIKGVLVGLFMAISVGPTLFAIIRYSLSFSYKAGLAFVLGVSVSDILYVTVANVAASFLQEIQAYERVIAIGGALALIGIGLSGLLRKIKPKRPSAPQLTISTGDVAKIWLSGFLINTLNPGVLITWLGAVTVIANKDGYYRFILFTTALIIILGIDFAKVFLAEKIKKWLTVRTTIIIQRISAACLLGIGLMILIGTLMKSESSNKSDEAGKVNQIIEGK